MREVAEFVKELGAVGTLAFIAVYLVVRLEPIIRENTQVLTQLNIYLKKKNGD